jgi:hypothetical protein
LTAGASPPGALGLAGGLQLGVVGCVPSAEEAAEVMEKTKISESAVLVVTRKRGDILSSLRAAMLIHQIGGGAESLDPQILQTGAIDGFPQRRP